MSNSLAEIFLAPNLAQALFGRQLFVGKTECVHEGENPDPLNHLAESKPSNHSITSTSNKHTSQLVDPIFNQESKLSTKISFRDNLRCKLERSVFSELEKRKSEVKRSNHPDIDSVCTAFRIPHWDEFKNLD